MIRSAHIYKPDWTVLSRWNYSLGKLELSHVQYIVIRLVNTYFAVSSGGIIGSNEETSMS
jgi:hypothetical protein